jgi:transcriptional regulator with XRE-family HTH domain
MSKQHPSGLRIDGARVRYHREARGLLLRQLAASAGLDPSYLSRIERGVLACRTLGTVLALARCLDLPLTDLTTDAELPETED